VSTVLSATQTTLVPQQQTLCDDWKQQLTERLDAYRVQHPQAAALSTSTKNASTNSRASKIARTVASRYAAAPTYSELLAAAAQAARAEETARADADAAAEALAAANKRVQQAAAMAQASMSAPSATTHSEAPVLGEQAFQERYGSSIVTESMSPVRPAKAVLPQFAARTREMHLHQAAQEPEPSLEDLLASALVEPRAMLPSKLIEFPRELVSSRRARPRLPESPSREQAPLFQEEELAQLRIFEVQPEIALQTRAEQEENPLPSLPKTAAEAVTAQAMSAVAPPTEQTASSKHGSQSSTAATAHAGPALQGTSSAAVTEKIPSGAGRAAASNLSSSRFQNSIANPSPASSFRQLEWASISLDKEPASYRQRMESSVAEYVPFMVDPASIDRRVMAFAVDFAAVTAGFLGFLVVFVASTPHIPTGLTAVALAGAVYVVLWVLYQMLFFTLSGATAGMLYARIALCTFDDQNPSRSTLRRRLGAWWVSFLPLGIGFLWCFVDEDNLCWHDRITRMYQREY